MTCFRIALVTVLLFASATAVCLAEDWPQLKFDARRSGEREHWFDTCQTVFLQLRRNR